MDANKNRFISRSTVFLMAVGAGSAVANNYYNQPLLPDIAHSLSTDIKAVGLVAAATQVGYAVGLFFIAPLGDCIERKKLMRNLYTGLFFSLLVAATSQNIFSLILASVFIGLFATVVQQIIPFAASLAEPEHRGATVGSVMTGMTLGILLARTLSGTIGQYFGWRDMFFIAALLVVIVAFLLIIYLPKSQPTTTLPYKKLLLSMIFLFKSEKVLREAAIVGALWFACFGAFWATLAAYVSGPPFNYDAETAGFFGLLGIAGITATRLSGRLADKKGSRIVIFWQLILMIVAILIMLFCQQSLPGLILGTIILDYGVFGAQVANQARVFSLQPDARSRVNGIYMVFYYGGGALGSFSGTWAWQVANWSGVGVLCLVFLCLALVIHLCCGIKKENTNDQPQTEKR